GQSVASARRTLSISIASAPSSSGNVCLSRSASLSVRISSSTGQTTSHAEELSSGSGGGQMRSTSVTEQLFLCCAGRYRHPFTERVSPTRARTVGEVSPSGVTAAAKGRLQPRQLQLAQRYGTSGVNQRTGRSKVRVRERRRSDDEQRGQRPMIVCAGPSA